MITSRLNLESKNCCLPLLAFGSNYTHITRVGVTLQSSTCAKMQFLPLVQHGKEKNAFGNCFKVMNMTSYKNKVLQFWFNIVQRGLINILFRNEDYWGTNLWGRGTRWWLCCPRRPFPNVCWRQPGGRVRAQVILLSVGRGRPVLCQTARPHRTSPLWLPSLTHGCSMPAALPPVQRRTKSEKWKKRGSGIKGIKAKAEIKTEREESGKIGKWEKREEMEKEKHRRN